MGGVEVRSEVAGERSPSSKYVRRSSGGGPTNRRMLAAQLIRETGRALGSGLVSSKWTSETNSLREEVEVLRQGISPSAQTPSTAWIVPLTDSKQ